MKSELLKLFQDLILASKGNGLSRKETLFGNLRAAGSGIKMLLIPRKVIPGLRYFCLNHGSCGSAYIVELMKANGLGPSYHEKNPDLDDIGIAHYEGLVSDNRMKRLLQATRRDVFFEANNRLFAVSKLLMEIFPDAKFIHLHRDGRELIRSFRSKPLEITWNSGRRRYQSEILSGSQSLPLFERMCHYWSNYNERIVDDLCGVESLNLKFSDLVSGNVEALESFMGLSFDVRTLRPVNANKPVRKEGQFPKFEEWPEDEQAIFWQICGPTMKKLGYE